MAVYRASSFEHPLRSSRLSAFDPVPPVSPALEDTGIALSLGVLRIGYFYGGDGEGPCCDGVQSKCGPMQAMLCCDWY
jgi:hypothetical protein